MRRKSGWWTSVDTRGLVFVCICTVGASACAQDAEQPPDEQAGIEAAPASENSYTVRLDSERSDPGQFELSELEETVRILTGPAGIAYRDQDRVVSGDFRAEATFVQYGAPMGYREAYGIFVGGSDLDNPDQEYTYLLVRPTGDYLIKRRIGEITETIVDWTPDGVVRSVVAEGDEPENTLGVEVVEGETRFTVNGSVVHAMPSSEARPYGVAGLRVNHRLDVLVSAWAVTALVEES